jgi:hypothetical protein
VPAEQTVCQCGKPTRDHAVLCDSCVAKLRRWLRTVPLLNRQLQLTISRQTASGGRVGSRSATKPLPWNDHASDAYTRLRIVIDTWTRQLNSEIGPGQPQPIHGYDPGLGYTRPAVMPTEMGTQSQWLQARVNHIRLRPYAAGLWQSVKLATSDGWRAVDRPADKIFAGLCGAKVGVGAHVEDNVVMVYLDHGKCQAELYAKPGASKVECPRCGHIVSVSERRTQLLAEVQDVLWPTRGIADALAGFLQMTITPSAIRGMAHRGEITQRGTRPDGSALYRVGDVLEVLTRRVERKSKPKQRNRKEAK